MSMKLRRPNQICLAAGVLCLSMSSAHAAMITTPLYETTTLVSAPTITVTQLDLTSAGTLQISLNDLAWPELAQSLSFSLSTPTSVIERQSTSGTTPTLFSYEVTGPMTLFASVYAAPRATARAALYHMNISFTSVAPVPLPAGVWLLLSGLAGLSAMSRKLAHRHTAVTQS
jgi:hypothetical protein